MVFVGLMLLALASSSLAATCDNSTFPTDLNDFQIFNLKQTDASNYQECQQACCDSDGCNVWQFAVRAPAKPIGSCWIGKSDGEFTLAHAFAPIRNLWSSYGRFVD